MANLDDLDEKKEIILSPARRLAQARKERKAMKINHQLRSRKILPLANLGDLRERKEIILSPARRLAQARKERKVLNEILRS